MEDGAGKLGLGVAGVMLLLVALPIIVLVASGQEQSASAAACRPSGGESASAGSTGEGAGDVGEQISTREDIPEEYMADLEEAAATSGLSVDLLAAQIEQESGWDAEAVSPVGAQGLSQFMPGTWKEYGSGSPLDPHAAIAAQGKYMADLVDQVSSMASDEREIAQLALAAYNAGPGAVQDAGGVPNIPETQNYVETIMGSAQSNFSSDCEPVGGRQIGELGSGEWTSPLPGGQVTSGFGWRGCVAGAACNEHVSDHKGMDFSTGGAGEVVAPFDMTITYTGTDQYRGELIVAEGVEAEAVAEFHHCQPGSTQVADGDTVAVGTPLCTEGSSGNSGGSHLHFQLSTTEAPTDQPSYDWAIDPEPVLREKGVL